MKKLIIIIFALLIVLTGCAHKIKGDVDMNSVVDGRDSVRLMKYLEGLDVVIDENNADVTGDGIINFYDEQQLLHMFVEADGGI